MHDLILIINEGLSCKSLSMGQKMFCFVYLFEFFLLVESKVLVRHNARFCKK